MKSPRFILTIAIAGFAVTFILIVSGCREALRDRHSETSSISVAAAPKRPAGQMYEISRNSNFVAQAAVDLEFEAMIHHPGEARPRRTVVHAKEGTWIVPEGLYTISPFPGHGIECDGKVCKVAE